jgi:predicted RNase H-like HicB family nuclease
MKYAVIFEPTGTGFSAYVPDFDGCVAAGPTLEKTRELIARALAMHIAGMREDGDAIPEPSRCELIEVLAGANSP